MATFVVETFSGEVVNVVLSAHVGETGATWTVHPSYTELLQVASSSDSVAVLTDGSTGNAGYYASGVPAGAEYDVAADFVVSNASAMNNNAGVTGRMSTSANTFYMLRYSVANLRWELFKAVAGSFTLLGSFTQSLTLTTYAARLEITDATKKVFVDGVERISSTDNAITAAGRAGMRWSYSITGQTGLRIDNFTATDIGGGGLTAVTKTATTRWDVINAISKDATLIWDILTSAGQSATLRWDLLNAIQSDATIRWQVLNAVSKDATVLWDLLNSQQVDATVRWDLLNAIQSDATLIWNVESSLAGVTQSATLRWDALNATQADATLRWHVLNAVSAQSTLLWDALNAAQVNATARWDVLEAITREITTRWDVLGLSAVAKTATIRWDTLESTTGSLTLRWSITDGSETPDLVEGAVRIDSITRKITIQSLTRKITIN